MGNTAVIWLLLYYVDVHQTLKLNVWKSLEMNETLRRADVRVKVTSMSTIKNYDDMKYPLFSEVLFKFVSLYDYKYLHPNIPNTFKNYLLILIFYRAEPLYTSFHDEEWGVPVHDDKKLFELLVLSQALAELTWLAILSKRATFRKLFDEFDPSSVAKFDEKKLLSMKMNGNTLLSEPKLRAIVENAKQLLKIQQEFGSFSNYCWRFVNHKPLKNGFRYSRQVPAKTPKSELISKDLMRRGFCCVGPTIVYSFMQVAGLVNDHLTTCFRYDECSTDVKKNSTPRLEKTEVTRKAETMICTVNESKTP
ncbi:uncharacterized protein LOC111393126 [Olea europaea var. sylvestris]|uniref:uncharacterized protein LOC111393126 n=1 Tax=Olea europaea var. sylvestris TaxID=158386 RepID=UPI000C1D640A|nr:uncharacterized protein LOC111393126 [Olea europaea var. sylvestris]